MGWKGPHVGLREHGPRRKLLRNRRESRRASGRPAGYVEEARASELIRATDILLTVRRVRLTPAWPPIARLRERRRGCSPQIRCCSLSRPPFRCATGLRCGCCGGSCCGRAAQEPCKINVVALLRFRGKAEAKPRSIRTALRPLFDTANGERDRLRQWDDRGNGGLHNSLGPLLVRRRSDAVDTVARGTYHPSLACASSVRAFPVGQSTVEPTYCRR